MRNIVEDEIKRMSLDSTPFGTKSDGVVPEYSQVYGKYLGHLEASHLESPCTDLTKLSPGCDRAAHVILPFLESQVTF